MLFRCLHHEFMQLQKVAFPLWVAVSVCMLLDTHTECAFMYMSVVCMYTCEATGKNWLSPNESQSYSLK